MKKKALLIGAGKRMQVGIIPALVSLQDHFEVTAVVSRSEKDITIMSGLFHMRTITNLDSIDFASIDTIIVAIPLNEVPNILKDLAEFATKHARLMLDTPVLPLKKLSTAKYFKNFREVVVAEDSIALPPYILARKMINEGKIGRLKKITLFNSGYRYHALATLKMLAGATYIKKIRTIFKTDKSRDMHISLPGGVKAIVIGPRDYKIGKFLIEGTSGAIANYDAGKENLFRIEADFVKMDDYKIQGLRDLFTATYNDRYHDTYHYINKYDFTDGLYDHMAIALSEKFHWFQDIPLPGKTTFWKLFIKLLS